MTIAVLDATGQTQQILSAAELSAALTAIATAVTGTVTSTQPVSIGGTVPVSGTFFQSTQPVSIAAPVAVNGTFFQATQPVSAASLPLPAGASTSAKQDTMAAAIALTTAAQNYAAVTPSDTVAVPNFATIKSLYVSVAGNLVVKGVNGTQVTLPVVVGQIVPFAPSFVMATGTTATVVALL